ncbi:unnamed protein product [Blepharisma stoltei]|uniref:Uncharacterized protein n=1 Tax=Blepharisma stoltei TaxID=1481888 RepID=A0AAU9I9K9_9CILI|nr:unnamed protein product [Blepharisma stoltei]
MYQEIEGQKPVIIARNHNARTRMIYYRWMTPPNWNPAWNLQQAQLSGLYFGITKALWNQIYNPASDLLHYYQAPDSLHSLRIFVRQMMKMENFRHEVISGIMFNSAYGLAFQTSRFYLWKDYAGGYPHEFHTVNVDWGKSLITAGAIGLVTCWIPVPFHNVSIRFEQDKILPKEYARGYRNHLHAAITILKKDGMYPFVRSAGPIMGEAFGETLGLFFWTDFWKEKSRHMKHWGTDQPGTPECWLRAAYVSLGVYSGLFMGYPFRLLRHFVEELPKNSKGELFFTNYAEAFWKALSDQFYIAQMWNGFHAYLFKAGVPLFLTTWFADSIGIFDQAVFPAIYVSAPPED